MFLFVTGYADAFVTHLNRYITITHRYGNANIRLFTGVFHCIVYQVAYHVVEMGAVCIYGGVVHHCQVAIHWFVRFKLVLPDKCFQHRFQIYLFIIEPEVLTLFHAHGQNLFHQATELLELCLDDLQISVSFFRVLGSLEVQHGIIGSVGYGYRGLELMSDVMSEILFHFFHTLLA